MSAARLQHPPARGGSRAGVLAEAAVQVGAPDLDGVVQHVPGEHRAVGGDAGQSTAEPVVRPEASSRVRSPSIRTVEPRTSPAQHRRAASPGRPRAAAGRYGWRRCPSWSAGAGATSSTGSGAPATWARTVRANRSGASPFQAWPTPAATRASPRG